LKYTTYVKLREREIDENAISIEDLNADFGQVPVVFYYYSIYSDSIENGYYIAHCLLDYLKTKKYSNYIFSGISYPSIQIDILREMGLKALWTDQFENESDGGSFMEGNFDMFLFGKMS
jgi:hypothetical protein